MMTIVLSACGGSIPNESIVLKVWGPQQEQNFLFGAAQRYISSFPEKRVSFEIASVSEVELKGFLTLDIPGVLMSFRF